MSLRGYSNFFTPINTYIGVDNFLVGFITGTIVIVCATIYHLNKVQAVIDAMCTYNKKIITELTEAKIKIAQQEATIIEHRIAALRREANDSARDSTDESDTSEIADSSEDEPVGQPPSYDSPPAYRTRVEVPPVPYVRGAENDRGRVVHPIIHYDIVPPMAIVALLNHVDNLYDAPNAPQRRMRDRIVVLLKHFIAEVENEKLYSLSLVENITRLISAYGYYDVNGRVAFGGLDDRTSPLAQFTRLAGVVKPWCLNTER